MCEILKQSAREFSAQPQARRPHQLPPQASQPQQPDLRQLSLSQVHLVPPWRAQFRARSMSL